MHRKPLRVSIPGLLTFASCSVSLAQQVPEPAPQPMPQVIVGERARALPPTTEANADALIQSAIQSAKNGDYENGGKAAFRGRIKDYPHITLKRLAPYAADPDEKVRYLVQGIADSVLLDREVPDLHAQALSLLVQVAAVPDKPDWAKHGHNASALMAINTLHTWLLAARLQERQAMRQKVDMAALKAAVLTYFKTNQTEESIALLTLFASDTTLKPLVNKFAVSDNYSTESLFLQAAWGNGNAIGALKQRVEMGGLHDLSYLTRNILALNEPNTLRSLWQQLDNKAKLEGEEYPVGNPNGKNWLVYPRICDYVLAAFRWKFDDRYDQDGPEHPRIATDAELAAAKAHYRPIIAALPQIGEQVGNAFEPF